MAKTRTSMVLNRPVFTQQRFSSVGLTTLCTLIHRFTEPGAYQVSVSGGGTTRVDSVTVGPAGTHHQVNIDMAKPGNGGDGTAGERSKGCCCEPSSGRELAVGGVVAFYASSGTGTYQARITQLGEREKRVVMDSAKTVPAGDFFAVTLVRPGNYRLVDELTSAAAEVRVALPERGRIDTEVVRMLRLSEGGFEPGSAELVSGQSIVVECAAEGRLTCELLDPERTPVATRADTYTYRRVRPRERG